MKIFDPTHLPDAFFQPRPEPGTYDYETTESLLVFLNASGMHPPLTLDLESYSLHYYAYPGPVRHLRWTNQVRVQEPRRQHVTLAPRLFLTCLRAAGGRAEALDVDSLVEFLEAELRRRKLSLLY